jgi:hypothetical protein
MQGFHGAMITRLVIMGVFLCGVSPGQTSADNPRLKAALERYPDADSNKVGIVTLEEAKAFRDKRVKGRGNDDGMAPEEAEPHVYYLPD